MPDPDPMASIRTPWSQRAADAAGPSAATDAPPVDVPDHTLIRCIGRGSYGEVWLARNVLGLHRAVKIIRRQAFDDDRPFERELAGIQRFEPISRSHESQLNILHVGRGPDCFYYVMELADDMGRGPSIDEASYSPRTLRSELLLRGRLPVAECLRLGLALTTALEHLHRHGLVHRDIKLSNIVFVNGIPKLADIGLVAPAQAGASYVGTEGYLPPEGPGTVPADLFSLGKVLYELGTGNDRQQFPDLPTNVQELPDRAALAEFNEVLLRACAPEVKQRYQSAAEMHADLALLQSGRSVSRMRAVERRLKLAVRAGAAVVGLTLLAGAAFLYQQAQTREARRLSDENRTLANKNRERVVRLNVANGVRLMDEGDSTGALLWFADALPRVTNSPSAENLHRIRLQAALRQVPQLQMVVGSPQPILAGAWSPTGRQFALATKSERARSQPQLRVQLHDAQKGGLVWALDFREGISTFGDLRFSQDGRHLFLTGWHDERTMALAAVLDTSSGKMLSHFVEPNSFRADLSPDNRWFTFVRTNHVIDVIRTDDGARMATLVGHTRRIRRLSFSGDGSLLASASDDRTARSWRLPSGESVGQPIAHERPLLRVALSDDGRMLATAISADAAGRSEEQIHLWDIPSQRRLGRPISGHSSTPTLFFSPGTSPRLITSNRTRNRQSLRIWSWSTGEDVLLQHEFDDVVNHSHDFSGNGSIMATGNDGGWVTLRGVESGESIGSRLHHPGYIHAVRFSPDGTRLLTTGDDGLAKVWALPGRNEDVLRELPARMSDASDTRDSGHFVIRLAGIGLGVVDPETLGVVLSLKGSVSDAAFLAGSKTGQWWAMTDNPGENEPGVVTLWRRTAAGPEKRVLPHPQRVSVATFTAKDDRCVTYCRDHKIRVWRPEDGALERTVPLPESAIYRSYYRGTSVPSRFTPDGQRFLVGLREPEEAVQLFDIDSGQLVGKPYPLQEWSSAPLRNWSGASSGIEFAPDGFRLGKVGQDQLVRIVDLRTGEPAIPAFKQGSALSHVAWSPDGTRLLTAGTSSKVQVWDSRTGGPRLLALESGIRGARHAEWSSDGRFITTRNDDGSVRVWDATTGEPLTPFLRHKGNVLSAGVTPGHRLVTASSPNLLRAWDLTPTQLPLEVIRDYAMLLSGRRLDAAGSLMALSAEEMTALFASLRQRAPELFARP